MLRPRWRRGRCDQAPDRAARIDVAKTIGGMAGGAIKVDHIVACGLALETSSPTLSRRRRKEKIMRTLLTLALLLPINLGLFAGDPPAKGKALFNGKDLTGWKFRAEPKRSKWQVAGFVSLVPDMPGRFVLKDKEGIPVNGDDGRGVDLLSEVQHGDCQLHIEFNVTKGSNSGVYFQGQYEVQILDSFGKADKDLNYGDCGGIYNTAKPRLNASKAPGQWQ